MFKEKVIFNKVMNSDLRTNEEKRELECIITFDCFENAIDFARYIIYKKENHKIKWETCTELASEDDNTLSLYVKYSHGEMAELKEEIKEMLADFNS